MSTSVIVSSNYSNSGTLTGDANNFALGILSPTTANITNSGTITQPGPNNNAIDIGATLTGSLSNTASGVISGTDTTNSQGNDDTVMVFGGITGGIANAGTISSAGSGVGAAAIDIGSGATNITNSAGGVLKSTGSAGAAALLFDQANSSTIVNAGQILATGSGGNGIYLGGALTGSISNSGTISETGGGSTATGTVPGVGSTFYFDTAILVNGGVSGGIQNSGTISGSGVNATIDIVAGSANITNLAGGVISHQGSGLAIDYSLAGAASTLTNAGTIGGSIELSGKGDTVILQGGGVTGDILASSAGSGTVEIAAGSGATYVAAGKLGDPSGKALADVAVESGTLAIAAGSLNAVTVTLAAGAALDLTGAASSGATLDSANHFTLKNAAGTSVESFQLNGAVSGLTFTLASDGQGGTTIHAAYGAALAVSSAASLTAPVAVADSAANIAAQIDGLESLALAGKLGSISLTDGGTPSLALTAAQLSGDGAALAEIGGNYTLTVSAGSSAATIDGPSAHATTVSFSGNASQYTVSSANGVISVSAGGVTDQLGNVSALKFADVTEIVAATPGPANAVTTGNVTELYSAVLAREPDVGGLAFYQNFLQKNPTTPLQTFATFFLNSSEYTGAHNYPETAAGDQQFITDSYQNLLHRTPSASEVSFYEDKVLAPAVAGQTAGTAGYAAAQLQAHALMLVYFSASSEFLSDVQITAANPASASHWLYLT